MDVLRKLSVRQKLISIAMITVLGVTVFLASTVVLGEAVKGKRSLYEQRTEQLEIVAEIIGSRSTAAVIFDDVTTATENLGSLSALRSSTALISAGIFAPRDTPLRRVPSGRPDERSSQANPDSGLHGC